MAGLLEISAQLLLLELEQFSVRRHADILHSVKTDKINAM